MALARLSADNAANVAKAGAAGAVEAAVAALRAHPADDIVQANACFALFRLCAANTANAAKAGAAGDRKRVAQLLYAGVQPLARDRMGRTVLHTAAANGAVAVLDYVLNGPSSAKGNPLGDKNGGGGGQGDPPKEMFETGKSYVGGGRDSGGGGSAWGSQSQLAVVDAAAAAAATAANARLARTLDVNPIDARGHTPLDEALRTGQEVATVMLRMRGGLAAGDPGYKEVQERGLKAGPSIRTRIRST